MIKFKWLWKTMSAASMLMFSKELLNTDRLK
jgi:hypothetical protein